MANKLRLLVDKRCNRKCEKCCNKLFNLDALEIASDFSKYKEISLTGGEPMLFPEKVISIAKEVRSNNQEAKIWLYTAKASEPGHMLNVINFVDGITLTLHNAQDIEPFIKY
jgi:pyruvate formate-lyase activating enzyme-like uncharacterized protein